MPVAQFKLSPKAGQAPAQQSLVSESSSPPEGGFVAPPESGFPDPFKILADTRKVHFFKEVSPTAKCINCLFGICGVTRYRYFIRDAATGRDLFKAKFSYSTSCNICAGGVRHNYSLELYLLPLDGSKFLKDQAKKGLFLSTSTSPKSQIAAGGHGVMDMRSLKLVGRLIPSPAGSITVKDASQATSLRIAVPIKAGYAANSTEMLIEDATTTALVGRLSKQWKRSDNNMSLLCCCCGSNDEHGAFTLDMSAVSNVQKRALLIMAGIIADAVAFEFRAAAPVVVNEGGNDDDKPLIN